MDTGRQRPSSLGFGSANPARSTGPAISASKAYIEQLWFFLLAPTAGAVVAVIFSWSLFRKPG